MRWALLVLCVAAIACKKQPQEEPAPAPSVPPKIGHSSTKLKDPGVGADQVSVDEPVPAEKPAETPIDAGEEVDAQLYGGNESPPFRDDRGHLHGPGGPIYMGRGPECTDKLDHCLRPGVWFAVGRVQPGKLYRTTPAFEFENKWWSFRGEPVSDETLYKTKVVERASELQAGSPVVWLISETSSSKWLKSEHDALTTSRWEIGVIDSVGTTTFMVKGWPAPVPIDTARVVVEERKQ